MFKEELDEKLVTAEEIFELFNDFDKLKNYKYADPVIGSTINPEEFYLELPYEDIRWKYQMCYFECFILH